MTLFVRVRGPQVTLQRRRRGDSCWIARLRLRRWGLVPSLCFLFLTLGIATFGFFFVTEMGISNEVRGGTGSVTRWRRTGRARFDSAAYKHRDFFYTYTISDADIASIEFPDAIDFDPVKGEFFRIDPLLNRSAPNIQLSAQLILNSAYNVNIKKDILSYYNWLRCRKRSSESDERGAAQKCRNFTLVDKSATRSSWRSARKCPPHPGALEGLASIPPKIFLPISKMDVRRPNGLRFGGWWEPLHCLPRHSVAIIIPYKDRWSHLSTLLNHLHPVLKRQQIRHRIYVAEQYGGEIFNKGILMNAGFIEALKDDIYHCFVFHDVDLIPENDENMYSCPEMPRHMSVAVNELNYTLPYPELIGGAFAIRTEHYFNVNGYSNFYWGWGGEDDDMAFRLRQSGLTLMRPTPNLGRYTMIAHEKRKPSNMKLRFKLLSTAKKRYRLEGLNSVEYKLVSKTEHPWFTTFLIDIGKPHPMFALYHYFNSTD